jgi:hypothetical protein
MMDNLRRSVRRWKTLALTLLVALGLVILLGAGTGVVQVQRLRGARQAEMEARQQAEEARDQARRTLYGRLVEQAAAERREK